MLRLLGIRWAEQVNIDQHFCLNVLVLVAAATILRKHKKSEQVKVYTFGQP